MRINMNSNEVICLDSSGSENDSDVEEIPADTKTQPNFQLLITRVKVENDNALNLNLKKKLGRKKKIYTCGVCKKELVGKMMYHYHMKKNHRDTTRVKVRGAKKKIYVCVLCQKQIRGRKLLDSHMKRAHPNTYNPVVHSVHYECPVCHVKIGRQKLDAHLDEIHQTSIDLLRPFLCAKCDRVFHRFGNLLKHMNIAHGESNIAPNLIQRNEDVDTNEIPNPEIRVICSKCQKSFSTPNWLLRHEFMCHSNKKSSYKCSFCPAIFTLNGNAKRHEKVCHLRRSDLDKKKTPARKCKVRDEGQANVNEESSFETELCNNSTQYVEKPSGWVASCSSGGVNIIYADKMTCSFCPKFFSSIPSKLLHEKIHTGDNPYRCKHCQASFRLPRSHADHEKKCLSLINTNWCQLCDYNNKSLDKVESHSVSSHGFDLKRNKFIPINNVESDREILVKIEPSVGEDEVILIDDE